MELVRIIAIHPIILFYLVIFHLDLVASRPALFPSGRLQEPNVRQAEESLGSRERTELSLNDKLAISLSIGLVALLSNYIPHGIFVYDTLELQLANDSAQHHSNI